MGTKKLTEAEMREENAFLKKKLEAMKRILLFADEQISLFASSYTESKPHDNADSAKATEAKSPGNSSIGAISRWSTAYAKSETPVSTTPALVPVPPTLSAVAQPAKQDEYIEADAISSEPNETEKIDIINNTPNEAPVLEETTPQPNDTKRDPQPEVTVVEAITTEPSVATTATAGIPEDSEDPTTPAYETQRPQAEIKKVLKQIFNHFDTNKDGKLSLPEVAAAGMAAQNWGFTLEPLSREQIKDMMRSAFGTDAKKISRQRFIDVCATSAVPVLRECADTITNVTELLRPIDAGGEPLIQDKDDEPVTTKTFFLKRPLRKVSVKGKSGESIKPSIPVLESQTPSRQPSDEDSGTGSPTKKGKKSKSSFKRRGRHKMSIAFGLKKKSKPSSDNDGFSSDEEGAVTFTGSAVEMVEMPPTTLESPELTGTLQRKKIQNPMFNDSDEDQVKPPEKVSKEENTARTPAVQVSSPVTTNQTTTATTVFPSSPPTNDERVELDDADYLLSMIRSGVGENDELTDARGVRFHVDANGDTVFRASDVANSDENNKTPTAPGTPTGIRKFAPSASASSLKRSGSVTHVVMAREEEDTKFGFDTDSEDE
eukprot:m.293830 g.293830  ORF g.293830 m.293830 type:complete len:602 (-) comp20026_c0_seq6:1934-3739(-)